MGSHGVHGTRQCGICKRQIGRNGMAWVSHMRAHVRKGQATERLRGNWMSGSRYEYYDKEGHRL